MYWTQATAGCGAATVQELFWGTALPPALGWGAAAAAEGAQRLIVGSDVVYLVQVGGCYVVPLPV